MQSFIRKVVRVFHPTHLYNIDSLPVWLRDIWIKNNYPSNMSWHRAQTDTQDLYRVRNAAICVVGFLILVVLVPCRAYIPYNGWVTVLITALLFAGIITGINTLVGTKLVKILREYRTDAEKMQRFCITYGGGESLQKKRGEEDIFHLYYTGENEETFRTFVGRTMYLIARNAPEEYDELVPLMHKFGIVLELCADEHIADHPATHPNLP